MGKRAVVLAGGGSRGAYQIGVSRAIRELGIDVQIVTGTSERAFTGALMVQDDYDFAYRMWQDISTKKVFDIDVDEKLENKKSLAQTFNTFASAMIASGGVDPKPLEEILREEINEEKINSSDIDFAVVTVEYPGFAPCIVRKNDFEESKLVDYLMASSSCFPAIKMRSIDGKRYIDGGYYDNMPIKLAIEMGADEIIAVDLDGVGVNRSFEAEGKKITHIRSYWNLGVFLLFDSKTARQNIKLGYLDGLKHLGNYEGSAYTFYEGECEKLENIGLGALGEIIEKLEDKKAVGYVNGGITSVAKNAVLRVLAKKRRRSVLKVSNIVSAAEISAEVFALSPLKAYTADEFRIELLKAYERRKEDWQLRGVCIYIL